MEFIPEKYQAKDLPIPASFECDDIGLQLTLESTKSELNPQTGVHERIARTGCRLKFRGGMLHVHNRALLAKVMGCSAYKNGKIRIDSADVNGFWRKTGLVKTVTREVVVSEGRTKPSFEAINLKEVTPPKKGEDGKSIPVQPLIKAEENG